MNLQMEEKWTPTPEDYKRLESVVIKLMLEQAEQRKLTNGMAVAWVLTVIFCGFKLLFG